MARNFSLNSDSFVCPGEDQRLHVLIVFIIAGVNSLFHDHTVMALDCPVNESYHICGPACEPSCARPKPLRCENKCVKNACQCKPGYIREFTAGMCIPMEECNVRRGKALEDAMVPISNGIAQ
ncbi:trypsin Inhibitor like cysteine rich domain protein [Ancylostoma ceylanicum]|uniref:Trypsin Inhibitor like cysteine rich domain protein n=1 Tax=Ancylostoma ceylanicum TaxID=53326 RepID=A0A0D6LUH6_9BILA|nr:trypsin Inhibitor like cysteine rich domain protein [Ancylostoma ceylanicum]